MVLNRALLYSVVQGVVKVEVPAHLDLVQLTRHPLISLVFWILSLNLVWAFRGVSEMGFILI